MSGEATEEGEPEVTEREREVLVEEVAQELAYSVVGPATVNEKQSLKIAELADRKVTR